jgi:GT2 family glycosyltransferase
MRNRRIRQIGRRARRLRLAPGRSREAAAATEVQALAATPLISLVMPTYRTELKYLRIAIDSVRGQVYPEWELCIIDDGSGDPRLNAALERAAAADERIRFEALPENRGISAATNRGLEMCRGEFVGFLDHDDALTPDALLRVAQALTAHPELDMVYSDSDKLTPGGRRTEPFLKPDWSPVYALGAMYVGHLLVVRRSVAEQVGGFDSDFDTIQDFEFMLRVSERIRAERIYHIPEVLYHWRAIPGSIAAGAEEKSGVPELQARAVNAHLERTGVEARSVPHAAIPHRAVLAPRNGGAARSVSLVLAVPPGGDGGQRLLSALEGRRGDAELEIIVVGGDEPPEGLGVTSVDPPGTFSRGRWNNAGAERAGGELLLFCSPEVEPLEPEWLDLLVIHAALPGVAAAGPMLVRPDGRVDQAGIAIALRAPATATMRGFDAGGDGYYGSLPCARDVAAVGAECMMIERAEFERLGGFSTAYSREYEDFDLCMRLRREGRGVVYTPRPQMRIRRPAGPGAGPDIVDRALFVDSWFAELQLGDPYFNPNFSRRWANYVPADWREKVHRATAPPGRR